MNDNTLQQKLIKYKTFDFIDGVEKYLSNPELLKNNISMSCVEVILIYSTPMQYDVVFIYEGKLHTAAFLMSFDRTHKSRFMLDHIKGTFSENFKIFSTSIIAFNPVLNPIAVNVDGQLHYILDEYKYIIDMGLEGEKINTHIEIFNKHYHQKRNIENF